MRRRSWTFVTLTAILSLTLLAAAGCGSRDAPAFLDGGQQDTGGTLDGNAPGEGEEGGPCYPNNTCNAGLICVNGTCVKDKQDAGKADVPVTKLDQGLTDGPVKDVPQQQDGPVKLDGPAKLDGPVITPDTTPPPDLPVTPDAPVLVCNPPGYKPVVANSNAKGAWSVALEQQTTYTAVGIPGAATLDAAATADYNQSWQQVAGFVVSRAAGASTAGAVASAMITDVSGIFGTVTVTSNGTAGTTHDGYAAVFDTTFSLTVPSASDVSYQRNNVLAAVLKKSGLTGLPGTWGVAATSFVVRVTTVLRGGGRAIFVGAVTDSASDGDASKNTRIIARDLTSATGLAAYGKTTANGCENQTVTKPPSPVDIIWVMDETGSMYQKLTNIAANAASFFQLAQSKGLNFRMGVTGVNDPNTPSTVPLVGKFCSNASQADGGTDRFLLPSELALFQACIQNPPGNPGGVEYGLANAMEAVKKHLPRAANQNNKIRTGAQLVIITVTDELPQDIFGNDKSSATQCTLSASAQTTVNTALQPYMTYFNASASKVNFYQVIGGVCGGSTGSCYSEVAHGYKELAAAFNGAVYDVCQSNLSTAINTIISDIQAAAGGVSLTGTPVAASLRLAVDGATVQRSLLSGFNYDHLTKAITFAGTPTIKVGSLVVATYKVWQ